MVWKNDQVSGSETEKIIEIAKEQLNVQGDFVELGCYKGDTSLLLAEILRDSDKKLWVYDSFEGLPEKSMEDLSLIGENFREGELFVTKREVKERFLRSGLPVPIIKKSWFANPRIRSGTLQRNTIKRLSVGECKFFRTFAPQ